PGSPPGRHPVPGDPQGVAAIPDRNRHARRRLAIRACQPEPLRRFMRAPKSIAALLPCLSLAAAWGAVPAESPYSMPQAPFYGQVRTRTEYDLKAMADTSSKEALLSTQLRTRLGFMAMPS